MAPPDTARLYQIAYEEVVRALAEQQAAVESLRNRAGLLLSAAAVTTSFLGARALESGQLGATDWLATASFVGVALACLAVLWPRRWEFSVDPGAVISGYLQAEEPPQALDLRRDLALSMYGSCGANERSLDRIANLLQTAVCLLTGEVILWVLAVAPLL